MKFELKVTQLQSLEGATPWKDIALIVNRKKMAKEKLKETTAFML